MNLKKNINNTGLKNIRFRSLLLSPDPVLRVNWEAMNSVRLRKGISLSVEQYFLLLWLICWVFLWRTAYRNVIKQDLVRVSLIIKTLKKTLPGIKI